MVQVTRSPRRQCNVDWCTVHRGNRKLGDHLTCERIVPEPGSTDGAVFRRLRADGTRIAEMAVYDRETMTWTLGLPLPAQPQKAFAAAVKRARAFVKTGEVR